MKQAVVILHGMGEQVPMQTLNSFIEAVWSKDAALVDQSKPDPDTGKPRTEVHNSSWAKPDSRNTSTELRRVTTESDKKGNRTDFYEYYWAHMMQGNTWENVRAWIQDLLLRNPFKRVPGRVLHAWIVLWLITLAVGYFMVLELFPDKEGQVSTFSILMNAAIGLAVTAFVSNVLVKRFGDVAGYTKSWPSNVAKRHEIQSAGVELLDRLIKSKEYDRIVVVAHSLGTIVAYEILAELYSRHNKALDNAAPSKMKQPARHALEEMIRRAAKLRMADGSKGDGAPLDIDAFQDAQAAAHKESVEQGATWIISDFVTLGSPLVHAEFLMAESKDDLRKRQSRRVLPTCPPTLEHDATTDLQHFSYDLTEKRKAENRRVPHHAALFGYTRWTNIHSNERFILTGDLISGPLSEAFDWQINGTSLSGIRDIAVLPAMDDDAVSKEHKRSFFTHNNYWNLKKGTERKSVDVPHHIDELRKALRLLED